MSPHMQENNLDTKLGFSFALPRVWNDLVHLHPSLALHPLLPVVNCFPHLPYWHKCLTCVMCSGVCPGDCADDVEVLEQNNPPWCSEVGGWMAQSLHSADCDPGFTGLKHHHHCINIWDGNTHVFTKTPGCREAEEWERHCELKLELVWCFTTSLCLAVVWRCCLVTQILWRDRYTTQIRFWKFWTLHTADEVKVKTPFGEHGYRDLQVWDNCWWTF